MCSELLSSHLGHVWRIIMGQGQAGSGVMYGVMIRVCIVYPGQCQCYILGLLVKSSQYTRSHGQVLSTPGWSHILIH